MARMVQPVVVDHGSPGPLRSPVEGATRMNQELGAGWTFEIDRGPDWLFISLQGPEPCDAAGLELAARIGDVVEREFANRLVLEMDKVPVLPRELVDELVELHARLTSQGGLLRVSGLTDENFKVVRASQLAERFPQYRDRHEAVQGYRPNKPR